MVSTVSGFQPAMTLIKRFNLFVLQKAVVVWIVMKDLSDFCSLSELCEQV